MRRALAALADGAGRRRAGAGRRRGARARPAPAAADPAVAVRVGGGRGARHLVLRAGGAVAAAAAGAATTGGRCRGGQGARRACRCRSLCGAIGVVLLVVHDRWPATSAAATALDNWAPTFLLITFWVGMVFVVDPVRRRLPRVQPVPGDRAAAAVARTGPYPERLGRWPAAVGLLDLHLDRARSPGWGEDPAMLVTAALIYTVYTLAAQVYFGVETWTRYCESFAVYFNLFAPHVGVRDARRRGSGSGARSVGLPRLDQAALNGRGSSRVMIGTVTFDGLSQGQLWLRYLQTGVVDTAGRTRDRRRQRHQSGRDARAGAGRAAGMGLLPARH